jgi:leucyl-tRNA synthetase
MDDPNWDSDFARGMHGKIESILRLAENVKDGVEYETPFDASLRSAMHRIVQDVTAAMEQTNFRTAIQLSFFELSEAVRRYETLAGENTNKKLLREALERQIVLLAPFIPHAAEEAWAILENDGFVSVAPWPLVDEEYIDHHAEDDAVYVEELLAAVRRFDHSLSGGGMEVHVHDAL